MQAALGIPGASSVSAHWHCICIMQGATERRPAPYHKKNISKPMKRTLLCALLAVASGLTATARETLQDSLYLFSYATDKNKNTGGLHLAWSRDGRQWNKIGGEYDFVKSDYGPWGSGKKMFDPVLERRPGGMWVCSWLVKEDGSMMALTESRDLLLWKPQDYMSPRVMMGPNRNVPRDTVTLADGTRATGQVHRVEKQVVENVIAEYERRQYRAERNAELMADDATRFAGLEKVTVTITPQLDGEKQISPDLFGVFFEDINYAADGGLYAELVQNRDFEYTNEGAKRHKDWGPTYAWRTEGEATLAIDTAAPIHKNNAHYAVLDVKAAGGGLANTGFDGIAVEQGKTYLLSLFGRVEQGSGRKVRVALRTKDGREIGSTTVTLPREGWRKVEATIKAAETAKDAELAVMPAEAGRYALDMVSLFPKDTYKGRRNGLRRDLAEAIADLRPRFVRFPGGCVAHGNGLKNIYRWKNTIGPLESRKGIYNIWNYRQSMGLGFYEYFQFCEDMGAEPLPVLAAGVPCQNSSLGGDGQQGGLPLGEEMDEYIQDVIDLIEWANGDKSTKWGRLRAEAGHPEPFNLKYIGIGNEDLISEVFKERFKLIYDAVRAKYPDIKIIGTAGPFYEGSDYEYGWQFAKELGVDIVDEHYYCPPGWFIHNRDFYDGYDRRGPQVYLGEYASHAPRRPNNMETALTLALYMTDLERNADIVRLSSYAPLMARRGNTQWTPDMMYFDNTSVRLTTDYYVQRMYGQNAGDTYIPATVASDNAREDVNLRIGQSIVRDKETGDVIIKLANLLPVRVDYKLDLGQLVADETPTQEEHITGTPSDSRAKPLKKKGTINKKHTIGVEPYSFTVIRAKASAAKKK